MREDVEVEVAYGAPLLLRGRRGNAPQPALARQTLRARIRHVEPEALVPREVIGLHNQGDRSGIAAMDGRLWKRVLGPATRMPVPPAGIREVAEALAGAGDPAIRLNLFELALDPWCVGNQYGVLAGHPRILGADAVPGDLALDLRAEAAYAVAGRMAGRIAHDGRHVWTALAPPLFHPEAKKRAQWLGAYPPRDKVRTQVGCQGPDADRYLAYLARTSEGAPSRMHAWALRSTCEAFGGQTGDLASTPLAGVAAFVRLHAQILHRAADSASGYSDEVRQALRPAIAAFLPLVARAQADLVDPRDLPEAVERMAALAALTLANRHVPGSHGAARARDVLAYVEVVARPALSREPPAEDAEQLGMLAP